MMARGHNLQARISDEARYDGWEAFIAQEGINLTALCEAIGRMLIEGEMPFNEAVVPRARAIQHERRPKRR